MPHYENVRSASAPARAGTINRACLASLTSLYGHPVATHWRVLCSEPKVLQTILDESELPEDVKSFKLVLEEMWNMARKVPTDEEAICKDVANECDGQGCPGLKRNFRGSHQYHRMPTTSARHA